MKKRIKINGFIIFACVIGLVFFPEAFFRLSFRPIDYLAGILGMVLALFGMLLRVCSRGFKSQHSASGKSLVMDGPYSLVRNPMYLGILCIAFGVIMLLFQWWTLLIFIIFFAGRYLPLIKTEEKILAEKFGKQYLDYKKSVPRILPDLNLRLSKKSFKYLPLRPAWIKKELNSILILVPALLVFDLWRKTVLADDPAAWVYFFIHSGIVCLAVGFMLFLIKKYESAAK
jgi:protein-S-isoprenylcysteine O-methyltransferase Ste14